MPSVISSREEFLDRFALERALLSHFTTPARMNAGAGEVDLGSPAKKQKIVSSTGFASLSAMAVDRFKSNLHPLFFGIAWKILDGVVELALSLDPASAGSVSWPAKAKEKLLRDGNGQLACIPSSVLGPVKSLYVNTIQVRHALVHRKVTSESGDLVGHTNTGDPLPPVTALQQRFVCELALWLARSIEVEGTQRREERRMLALLAQLTSHLVTPIQDPPVLGDVTRVKFRLDATNVLDMEDIKSRLDPAFAIDLELTLHDGTVLIGQIEEVRSKSVVIDPVNLPAWLTVKGHSP